MNKLFTLLILGGLLVVLLGSIAEMPSLGEVDNPSYNEVAEYYLENGVEDTSSTNIIAAIITDYRAFDTLGETTVLFTSIAAVISLLGIHRNHNHGKEGNPHG